MSLILIFTYTRCSYLHYTEWNTLHVPWHQLSMYVVQAFAIAGPYPPCTASQSCPQPERHPNCFLAPAKNISRRGTSALMRGGSLIMRCTYLCIDMDITLSNGDLCWLVVRNGEGWQHRWSDAQSIWNAQSLSCSHCRLQLHRRYFAHICSRRVNLPLSAVEHFFSWSLFYFIFHI